LSWEHLLEGRRFVYNLANGELRAIGKLNLVLWNFIVFSAGMWKEAALETPDSLKSGNLTESIIIFQAL